MSERTAPTDHTKDEDRRRPEDVVEPPRTLWAILRHIGPGLIIAANIVGSGELIMTTKTGADAGITLLWLILIGCVIKVFVQLELGRFTVSHGETTLTALNRIPGPAFGGGRGGADGSRRPGMNWVVFLWAVMLVTTFGQLGGIVAGVGQAMSLTFPLTGDYQQAVQLPEEAEIREYYAWQATGTDPSLSGPDRVRVERRMKRIGEEVTSAGALGEEVLEKIRNNQPLTNKDGVSLISPTTWDDRIWVVIIGFLTSLLLYVGRYRMIERFSVALVVSFTLITLGNVVALQLSKDYAIPTADILRGLSFHLPEKSHAITIALATMGIIGVGATELVGYPYWCLEKGYARAAGRRDESEGWRERALGWFRVMKVDAFASMVIYTLATAAFYLMGVAVLHADGRSPGGMRMVSTLAQSYVPVFGAYARWLFLMGAISVLYSTYLVANAGNARMIADFLGVIGLTSREHDSAERRRLITMLSAILPLICVAAFLAYPNPVSLVKIAGMAQMLLLPILALSAIYFRHAETDRRLSPGRLWDAALTVSAIALFLTGIWGGYSGIMELIRLWTPAAPV